MRRSSDHWFPACWVCPTRSRSPRQSQSPTASPRLPSLFLRRWCDPLVTPPPLYSTVQYSTGGVTLSCARCSPPSCCCTPQYHACCPQLSPSPPNICYLQRLQPAPLLLPPGLLGLARLRPAALPLGRGQHQPAALRRLGGARHRLLTNL